LQPQTSVPASWVGSFAGRLLALALIFAVGVLVDLRATAQYSDRELTALYALVLAGFLLALAYGALALHGRTPRLLARLELMGDGLLLLGFVYCSGGARSLFGVLYLIWIISAAVRAGSSGAVVTSVVATLGYGLAALGPALGWVPAFRGGDVPGVDEALASFGIHAAGFLAVALLAHRLADQLKRRQDELIRLGDLHARIVDNVSSGLLTVDGQSRITSFNHEAERITGYRSADVIGWELDRLFPSLSELGASGSAQRLELPFRNRRDETLHLGFSRSPLRDSQLSEIGGVLIFQDLTHVRQMEEQLRRSERMSAVGQLATGLAHEIRNPLASLSGAIELLGSDLNDDDAASRRLLRIVWRETDRLNRLVSDFLTYATGRPPEHQPVALAGVFAEFETLLASGGFPDLRLEWDVPESLAASGDPDQLQQVFWNLVLNAAQSEPDDGIVRVSARALDDDKLEISIADRGRGIPPEARERVFEPFFTTRSKGTGLGLALVHRVIEAHGGSVSVHGEDPKGTTVRVVLPRAA